MQAVDPLSAPSLEGAISRLVVAALVLGEGWTVWHYLMDPQKKSRLHRWLERGFRGIGRQWQTTALLIFAFAIAAFVPLYEHASLRRQMLDQICHDAGPELFAMACREGTSLLPNYNLTDVVKGSYVDVFQIGLWLIAAFLVGLVANVLIVRAKTKDTRRRVVIVGAFMAVLMWFIGHLQDLLGR
jgi:hypothetical protein